MQYLHHKQENLLITWGNTFYYLTIHSSPQKSTVSLTSFWQAVNLIYSRSHLYVPFMEDSNFRAGAGFTRHACKDKDSTCINQETPVSFLTFIMWPNTFFFFFSWCVSLLGCLHMSQAACHSVCARIMTPCGHSGKGKNNSAANGTGDIFRHIRRYKSAPQNPQLIFWMSLTVQCDYQALPYVSNGGEAPTDDSAE